METIIHHHVVFFHLHFVSLLGPSLGGASGFLPETNMFAPEKKARPGPKRKLVFQLSIFRDYIYVSFRRVYLKKW